MNLEGLSVPTQWKLDDGLALIRALQPLTRKYGYHIALGGGVLNKGFSDKDLDLYFLPMGGSKVKANPENLVDWLIGMWGPGDEIEHNLYPAEPPYIQRLTFQYGKQRIDVFVLGAVNGDIKQEHDAELQEGEEDGRNIGGRYNAPAPDRIGYWNEVERSENPMWRAQQPTQAQESLDGALRRHRRQYLPHIQPGAPVFAGEAGQIISNYGNYTTTTGGPYNWVNRIFSPDVPAQPIVIDNISADNEGPAEGDR